MTLPDIFTKILRDYFRWTAVVVVVVVIGIGYGLVLGKKVAVIQTISFSDRTRAKNDLAAASSYLHSLQSSLDKFDREFTAADRQRLDKFLPTVSEFPDVLLTVKNMADIAGLDLQTINVIDISTSAAAETPATTESSNEVPETIGTVLNTPGLAAQDVAITVGKGTSYDQFKRFLSIVESSGRLFDVVTLSYNRAAGGTESSAAVYAFTLRTYFLTAPVTETEPST